MEFWAALTLGPVGLATLALLCRYSYYQAIELDISYRRSVALEFHERVFESASRPLVLLGCAHRFSANQAENDISKVKAGSLTLDTRLPIANDAQAVRARWLDIPAVRLEPGGQSDDCARQQVLATWLFSELLGAA